MLGDTISPESILDQALLLAQNSSWESFSLSELANKADCSLVDIKCCYRSKDDMVEAFFNRADEAMLSLQADANYQALEGSERLVVCIMTWLEFLEPYRPIVKEMMAYKFEPGHFHLQARGITRVSRTVQWFIDVSGRNYSGLKRVADEVAITSAYLATFAYFLFDLSEDNAKTRAMLNKLVRKIDKGLFSLCNVSEK